MQVQGHHISSSKSDWWQRGEKEFINDPLTCDANRSRRRRRRMGGNDNSCSKRRSRDWQIWTIEEGTRSSCFRMKRLLVWGVSKASLDLRKIEKSVVFATCEVRESTPDEIDDDGKIPILPIQTQDGVIGRKLPGTARSQEGLHDPEQLSPVVCVACPCKRAQPLMRVCKEQRGPRTDNLTSFAPEIARSTDNIKTSMGWWQCLGLR
jgi:hypothetical protein